MDTMYSMCSDEELKIRAVYLFLLHEKHKYNWFIRERSRGRALLIDKLKRNDFHNWTYPYIYIYIVP